jgi:TPR repeat protein
MKQQLRKNLESTSRHQQENTLKRIHQKAKTGCKQTQYLLGVCYLKGKLVPHVNLAKAFRWLTTAAIKGQASAQFYVGVCLEHGYGTDENTSEANQWYVLSAVQGNVYAQFKLAEHLHATDNDPAAAYNWYQKAAIGGHAGAQCKLALWYHNNSNFDDSQARKLAFKWLKRSAAQKHPEGL